MSYSFDPNKSKCASAILKHLDDGMGHIMSDILTHVDFKDEAIKQFLGQLITHGFVVVLYRNPDTGAVLDFPVFGIPQERVVFH